MLNQEEKRPVEEKISVVDGWIETISSTETVEYINTLLLSEVLEYCGANFFDGGKKERRDELRTLIEYSNKRRAPGMRAVWGKNYDEYRDWTEEYVRKYEDETDRSLPLIRQKDKDTGEVKIYKNSGMLQFIGELTAYADGRMGFRLLKDNLETRARNGRLRQQGRKEELKTIDMDERKIKDGKVVIEPKEIKPSSFPPGFPSVAWEKIKTWR
jgi:hypothetical protein